MAENYDITLILLIVFVSLLQIDEIHYLKITIITVELPSYFPICNQHAILIWCIYNLN